MLLAKSDHRKGIQKMKAIPKIQKYMSSMPHTIGADIPLLKAIDEMKANSIRHLPVQRSGKLVGVLTERDVRLASGFDEVSKLKVEDVMMPDPYSVHPDAPLDVVVLHMAEHKLGCTVIEQDNGKVVGIFTATDGLRVLSEVLHQNYKNVV